jgi:hypothetical protein
VYVIAQSQARSFTVASTATAYSSTNSQLSASQGTSNRSQSSPTVTLKSSYTAIHNGQPESVNSSATLTRQVDDAEDE